MKFFQAPRKVYAAIRNKFGKLIIFALSFYILIDEFRPFNKYVNMLIIVIENKTPQAVAMEYVKYYNAHDLRKLCNLYASHCRNIQYALNTPINGKQAISEA